MSIILHLAISRLQRASIIGRLTAVYRACSGKEAPPTRSAASAATQYHDDNSDSDNDSDDDDEIRMLKSASIATS